MAISREEDFDPDKNTPLHVAILKRDNAAALELIKEAGALLNKGVLFNTPLLLAIKTANFEVARALLSHPDIDVTIADKFGMTAIHWAAFFRADDLIELILAKNNNVNVKSALPSDEPGLINWVLKFLAEFSAADFYEHQLPKLDVLFIPDFISELETTCIIPKSLFVQIQLKCGRFFEPDWRSHFKNITKKTPIVDIALTTFAYHADKICLNYCGSDVDPKNFMDSFANDERAIQDAQKFKHNFKYGYPIFCEVRNKHCINPEVLGRLRELEISQKTLNCNHKNALSSVHDKNLRSPRGGA